jgi:hypothetical protein
MSGLRERSGERLCGSHQPLSEPVSTRAHSEALRSTKGNVAPPEKP